MTFERIAVAPTDKLGADPDQACTACRKLLPHLEMALAGAGRRGNAADPRTMALDALPFPVFVCDPARRLLYANAAGHGELDRQTWLRLAGDCLVGANLPVESRLAAALAASPAADDIDDDQRLTLLQDGEAAADLVCRPVEPGDGGPHWVLRLVLHAHDHDVGIVRLGANLGLTPRQVQLAQLLLAGCTLTDAAKRLGIVRGSANDLLKRLFAATGTRRQAELVGYLNRRSVSR